MISTRYLAGTIAVSLLSLPFVAGSSPASAAAGTVSVNPVLYTGATETITFVDGDETGAYTVELWGTAKLATITSGSDIADLGTSYKWTIPTGVASLVATGVKVKVVHQSPATFTDFETTTFDIEKSKITTSYSGDWFLGATKTVSWTKSGATGGKVDISLVPASGKVVALVKGTENDGSEIIKMPVTTTAAAGYKLRITPSNTAALAGDSAAFEIKADSTMTVDVDDLTITKGQRQWVWPETDYGPVKLDLVLKSAPTKSVLTIAKAATAEQVLNDEIYFDFPAKLATGTYQVLATVIGSKPAITTLSSDIVVSGFGAMTLHSTTVDALAAGVVRGQSVPIRWNSSTQVPKADVTVTLIAGTKETKLDAKEVTVDGDGNYIWLVDSKLAAGSTYKLAISYNALKSGDTNFEVESSAFTVGLNPTVVVTAG